MILYSDIPIVPLSVVQAVLIRTEKLIEFLFCHFMHRLTHPKKIYHVLPYIISSGIGTLPTLQNIQNTHTIFCGNRKISSIEWIADNLYILIFSINFSSRIIYLLISCRFQSSLENISFLLMERFEIFRENTGNSGWRYEYSNVLKKLMYLWLGYIWSML